MANQTLSIILSKDRAYQCEASIRSFLLHCRDPHFVDMIVYWTTSNGRYRDQYLALEKMYPCVQFIEENDFRHDIVNLVKDYKYFLGLVDDNLYLHGFSIRDMEAAMKDNVLGFSMRLGKNLDYCFTMDKPQNLPDMECKDGICRYRWPEADLDFGYALEWSSTMYRVKDLLQIWLNAEWNTPHWAEVVISRNTNVYKDSKPIMTCYETSAAVSNPLNIVKSDHTENRKGDRPEFTVESLADRFDRGEWADVNVYSGYEPHSAHAIMGFIQRKRPVVSIVVPSYKKAKWLPDCIDSVLGQTFKDWELIVVNDCSPDNTSEIVEGVIKEHPALNIRLINSYYNSGVARVRNAAIFYSVGKYIFPLDADDMYLCKDSLSMFMEAASSTGADVVYSNYVRTGDMDGMIVTAPGDKFLCQRLPNINVPYFSMYTRSLWERVGGYNPEMAPLLEDWEFWTSCIEAEAKAEHIDFPLLAYRIMYNGMNLSNRESVPGCMEKIRRLHPKTYGNHKRILDGTDTED